VALVLLCCGCAHVAPRARPSQLSGIDYSFRVDPSLASIEARACFVGRAPSELSCGVRAGAAALRGAWLETAAGLRALPVVGQQIDLRGAPDAACVRYTLNPDAARGRWFAAGAERRGDALVMNTALLLWRPMRWGNLRELSVRVILPDGMRVSVPWPRQGDRYVLDQSALAFYAFAVFGRFDLERIEVPGATIEAAVLDGLPPSTRARVVPWLERAGRAAALAFGHFPRAQAQVVVVPTGPASEPVRFGTMNRGGGASAALLLAENAELEPLLHDWVAVHEFCHLLHPFVDREDAWFSEGTATYYQEVLRVRAGMEPEQDAWRRLYEGSLLGREARGNLVGTSAGMSHSFDFRTVYWAGASFALLADVELRRHSHGKLSLELALRELATRGGPQAQPLRARDVLERIDQIAGAQLLVPLMQRWVEGPQLPELGPLYERLGVHVEQGTTTIASNEQDAWIREAIMHGVAAAQAESVARRSSEP
jgi:hypothetical protein